MAILTKALEALLLDRLGEVPPTLTTAVSSLTAAQRDGFVRAWLNAPAEQHQQPAEAWALREDDRAAFTTFQSRMNEESSDEPR